MGEEENILPVDSEEGIEQLATGNMHPNRHREPNPGSEPVTSNQKRETILQTSNLKI